MFCIFGYYRLWICYFLWEYFYLQQHIVLFFFLFSTQRWPPPTQPFPRSRIVCFDCLHKMKSYLYCGYSKQQIIVSNVLRAAQKQKNISPMTLHYDPCWLRKYKSQYLQASYDDWNFLQGKSKCLNVRNDDHGQKQWNQRIAVLLLNHRHDIEILSNTDKPLFSRYGRYYKSILLCKKKGR